MSAKTVESVVASFVAELREVMRDQLLSSLAHWEVAPTRPVAPPTRPKTASFVVKAPRPKPSRFVRSRAAVRAEDERIVAYISAHGGCSSKDVSRALGLRGNGFGNATARLKAAGRIRRVSTNGGVAWFLAG